MEREENRLGRLKEEEDDKEEKRLSINMIPEVSALCQIDAQVDQFRWRLHDGDSPVTGPSRSLLNHRRSIPGILHSSRSNVSDAETEGLAESSNLLTEGTLF
ncbi:hypothetical protein KM043_006555 [Ampulex compressa]|nr:hypothetical protein KM043_006555 [Ampulex compressa]